MHKWREANSDCCTSATRRVSSLNKQVIFFYFYMTLCIIILYVHWSLPQNLQSGGRGTNGSTDILDIDPLTIHDRTPVFIGDKEEIQRLHECIEQEEGKKWSRFSGKWSLWTKYIFCLKEESFCLLNWWLHCMRYVHILWLRGIVKTLFLKNDL